MFSGRQLAIGIGVFFLAFFLLVPSQKIVHALGCEQSCAVYACDVGFTCNASKICKAPLPSCSGVTPSTSYIKDYGTMVTKANGVTNATLVEFPIYSNAPGDIPEWIAGDNIGGGTWEGRGNIANHSFGATIVRTDVYLTNCSYSRIFCGSHTGTIDTTPPTCSVTGPTSVCVGESPSYTTDSVDAQLINDGYIGWHSTTESTPQVWNGICLDADCTGTATFSSAGTYYVVCNAYDAALNQCTGNPFGIPGGYSDCGGSDSWVVTVKDLPAAGVCSSCGPETTVSDGTCTGTKVCACTSSAPIAPTNLVATQDWDLDFPTRVYMDWYFGWGMVGCAREWGYACGTQTDTFTIKIDGVDKTTGITPGTRTATAIAGSWGAHTAQVCALNGYTTTCSAPINFTLTAPACTVANQSPAGPTCDVAFPDLSATYGGGADQIQYAVDNENTFTNPWTCNSGWVAGGYTSGCDPATGTYYWTARAQSTASPTKCSTSALSPAYTVQVDKTAPTIPSLSTTATDCSNQVIFSWPNSTDTGCFQNIEYWLQAQDGAGNEFINTWTSSPYTVNSPVVGRLYKARAFSSDNGASHTNQSAWSNAALWTPGVAYCCPSTPSNLSPNGAAVCTGQVTFPSTYSWTGDANASGYYLTIAGCFTDKWIAGAATNSYTLLAEEKTTCVATNDTGLVAWSVRAAYNGGCSDSPAA